MRADATSWKCEAFADGVELTFRAHYTLEQFERLRNGLIPEVMEDKWFVYFEQPYLFFHRSWTGQPVYRLKLEEYPDGVRVVETLWSRDLAVAQGADAEYQVKLLDFLVSNLLLGEAKPFPRPSDVAEPMPGVLQHHVSGTGYREEPPFQASPLPPSGSRLKRKWWKLW